MSQLEVLSPHNGSAVRVRDKDVGRSVRDGDGKVFFVLERDDGEGYYASLTRTGGVEQQRRYDALVAQGPQPGQGGAPAAPIRRAHDATGRKRSNVRGKLVILLFILLALALIALWAFTVGPWGDVEWNKPPPPKANPGGGESKGPG